MPVLRHYHATLARRGVTVNAIAPGFIDTAMTRAVAEDARQHWIQRIPCGRAGTPEDLLALWNPEERPAVFAELSDE